MKTFKQIRMMAAMAVVAASMALSACKKTEVNPAPSPPATNPPPVVQVSTKPVSISTTSDGLTVRLQNYEYDNTGKLVRYISKAGSTLDTMEVTSGGNAVFKNKSFYSAKENLFLNSDKTYKSYTRITSSGSIRFIFQNNGQQLSRLSDSNTSITDTEIIFQYLSGQLNLIRTESKTVNMNYYSNLPYQKGINEIPFSINAVKYHKLLEMEGRTSTKLYNKLINQVIIRTGSSTFELHQFTYRFDSHDRVTEITDTITNTTSTTSSQKVVKSVISY